jgi:tripartite-type tricarboxylate transporter receptor subunit TctC
MKIKNIILMKWAASLLLVMVFADIAGACPNYPCKPIRVVVPMEAGGGIDGMARVLAQVFSSRLAADVVVLNKPGAFGAVGASWAASAPNDGYTLLMTGLNHVTVPVMSERAPYDPVQDFTPVAKIAESAHVLLVNSDLPINNIADLSRLSRQRPQGLTLATTGGATRIAAESFQRRTGATWLYVPYKGSSQALRSTISGETDLIFASSQLAQVALDSGRVRALAVSHPRRVEYMPAVPTLRELGFDDTDLSQWYGLLAPAGTPVATIDMLEKAIRQELIPGGILQKYIQNNRLETSYLGKQEFKYFLQEQARRIKLLNVDMNN